MHPLTSFSPQILLMMELEAGLAEGPRTATTPLDIIWHTEKPNKEQRRKNKRDGESETMPVMVIIQNIKQIETFCSHLRMCQGAVKGQGHAVCKCSKYLMPRSGG